MKIIRKEVNKDIPTSGSFFELMDMMFLPAFNVTAKEMDYISKKSTDEEIDIIISAIPLEGVASFSIRRKALELRNKYLLEYNGKV